MMYEEHAEHARQHETLRAAVAGFVIALVAGLLATEASKNHPVVVAGVICVVSLLGLLLNLKHYERYKLHREVLAGFRGSLEEAVDFRLRTINKDYRKLHAANYKPLDPRERLELVERLERERLDPANHNPVSARILKAADKYSKRSVADRYYRRWLDGIRLHQLWSAVYGLIFVAAMAWGAWAGWEWWHQPPPKPPEPPVESPI